MSKQNNTIKPIDTKNVLVNKCVNELTSWDYKAGDTIQMESKQADKFVRAGWGTYPKVRKAVAETRTKAVEQTIEVKE